LKMHIKLLSARLPASDGKIAEQAKPEGARAVAKKIVGKRTADFIETMDCLPVVKVPEGPEWTYEIKLDGYRLEVVRADGETTLYSRRRNVLNQKFPYIATALDSLPDGTVIDGELVAAGADGHPNFNLLQNFRSAESHITYYAFDILFHKHRDLTMLPLSERREILRSAIKPGHHLALSEVSNQTATQMLNFVRSHGLEGVVAKRIDGVYQPGQRTGLWSKHRINLGQEFVIGGYTPGTHGLDALVIGFYQGKELHYAARVRAGFVPATRREVFAKIKDLTTTKCPFANLPEKQEGRWGQGLTAEKMKECVWLRPEAVARIDFLEWTGADHLRYTKFVALRDDKDPRKVVRET
jgi:DNA ligase D-like protein (predicted ligase)